MQMRDVVQSNKKKQVRESQAKSRQSKKHCRDLHGQAKKGQSSKSLTNGKAPKLGEEPCR